MKSANRRAKQLYRRRMTGTGVGLILAASVVTVASVAVATEDEATLRAISAGYKAAFTCSATFNAGKSPKQINAHELAGIAPDYAEFIEELPEAEIDFAAKSVSVSYISGLPPRMAQWRPHLGCAQLPVGADAAAADLLPTVKIDTSGLESDTDNGLPWTHHAPVGGSSGNAALDKSIMRAFEAPAYGRDQFTTAILIATPDAIIAEHYIEGLSPTTSQRTWSVAKSIAASMIGVAVEKGIIDVDAPAGLEAWSRPMDPRGAITLQNLLQMASGLDSNRAGNRTDRLYFGGGLVSDTATRAALEVRPGQRWKYANNDTLLAVRALREKIGDRDAYLRFPFQNLLFPIGMTHTQLETDWDGNFVMSSQVWTTARDLARLGLLHLNDGIWNGERLLPQGWARYVSTPAPAQPAEHLPGYGAQWWLYNERFPDVPDDAFAARGNRGQLLLVIPSKNLVIVRRGHDPSGGEGFQLHDFARDVLAALGR